MENQASAAQSAGIFSERSQMSITREGKLREEHGKISRYISRVESELAELERDKARMARLIAAEGQPLQLRLADCIQHIDEVRASLKAFQEEADKTQRAVDELTPTPAQIEARRALHRELVGFGHERLDKTRQVEGLLQQLRQALEERNELAEKMRNAAKSLKLEISGDGLDEGRFEECLDSLPESLLSDSERWHDLFFGESGR